MRMIILKCWLAYSILPAVGHTNFLPDYSLNNKPCAIINSKLLLLYQYNMIYIVTVGDNIECRYSIWKVQFIALANKVSNYCNCQPHLILKIDNLAPLQISSFISRILLVCENHRALKLNVTFLFLRSCWQTAFNKGYAAP